MHCVGVYHLVLNSMFHSRNVPSASVCSPSCCKSFCVAFPLETLPPSSPRRSEWRSSLPPDLFTSRGSISHFFSIFRKRLPKKSSNTVVFPFAFHIAVQQPFKPLWSRLLIYDHEPSRVSFSLCFKSLLMWLIAASKEFVPDFPSP